MNGFGIGFIDLDEDMVLSPDRAKWVSIADQRKY